MFLKKLNLMAILFCLSLIGACSQTGVEVIEGSNPVLLDGIQVGLLIDPSTGSVMIDGVSIADDSNISTALDILLNSGVDVVTADFGQFGLGICSIAGVGQPENDCFGDSEGRYWAFFYKGLDDDVWSASQIGAGEYQVNDGDLIAFVWTASDMDFNPVVVPDNAWMIENFF
ncbi:DUF4430 domain-containing protein [bacterium]|nr:DUF4430 domain-containing protein [bacterium]